jgi:hypothetical protein
MNDKIDNNEYQDYLQKLEKSFDIVEQFLRKHNFNQVADKVRYNRCDNGMFRILRQISIEFIDDDEELINFYNRISPEPHFEDLIIYFLATFTSTFLGTYLATKFLCKNDKKNLTQRRNELLKIITQIMRGFMYRQMLHEGVISYPKYKKLINNSFNPEETGDKKIIKFEKEFLKYHKLNNFEDITVIIKKEIRKKEERK